jgi:hypothetical protein
MGIRIFVKYITETRCDYVKLIHLAWRTVKKRPSVTNFFKPSMLSLPMLQCYVKFSSSVVSLAVRHAANTLNSARNSKIFHQ